MKSNRPTGIFLLIVPTMVNFIKSKSKFEANNRYIYIKKNSGGTIKRKIPVGLLFFIIIRNQFKYHISLTKIFRH